MPQRSFLFGGARPTPIVLATLVLLVAAYLLTAIGERFVPGLYRALILDADAVQEGQVWRLLSYGLLHDLSSPFHLVLNGLMFWVFGSPLEARWGARRFLVFLFATVFVGGLFVFVGALLGISTGLCLGFSAAVEGCIVAWGLLHRDVEVRFLFAIPMRGIHFVWLAVFLAVLDAVSFNQVSAAAHFGGMATAAVLVLGLWKPNTMRLWWDVLLVKLRIRKPPKLTLVPKSGRGRDDWVH